jgi:hypothetical protein
VGDPVEAQVDELEAAADAAAELAVEQELEDRRFGEVAW